MAKDKGIYRQGDDSDQYRLLNFFQSKLNDPIIKIKRIRDHIYKIETKHQKYVGKGFSNASSLRKQKWLTDKLHEQGFTKTYRFVDIQPTNDLKMDHKYFGFIEWVEHSKDPFMYNSLENCQKGIKVLKEYHDHTESLTEDSNFFTKNNPEQKWIDRYQNFHDNISYLLRFIPLPVLKEILNWGKESLRKIPKLTPNEKNKRVILHGDVAHHNFIRTLQNDIYLIDFDLASIGHPIHDYLQYANRILPFLEWDLNKLADIPLLSRYLQDPYFLNALTYPTDIYREWNRVIKNNWLENQKWMDSLFKLTLEQYEQRQNFINSIKHMVK